MGKIAELAAFSGIGLFGTNAIPHFVQGITGRRHMTPLGAESSAVLNVLWGSANAAVAGVLAWRYRDVVEPARLGVAFISGVALAVGLASFWSDENSGLPWE